VESCSTPNGTSCCAPRGAATSALSDISSRSPRPTCTRPPRACSATRRRRARSSWGLRYWFASIARNSVRRRLRRDRNRHEVNVENAGEEREEGRTRALPVESLVIVRDALYRLPRSQEVAYVLREGLALSWRTIGFAIARRRPPAAR